MSTMIERVARAIGSALYGECDPNTTPELWTQSVALARASVAAMREPTSAMLAAADISSDDATENWQRMIDTAAE